MAYIGQEPGLGQAQRSIFTAVAVTDTVTADDDGLPLNYTVGQVSVYLNGVKQVVGTDVTCDNGSTVVFDSDYAIGDVIEVIALSTFSPADTVPASGGTFSGNVIMDANLTVSGTTTTIDTALTVSDAMVVNNAGSDVGVKVNSTSSGHIMQLQDSGTDVLVVADGGKVGIGTAALAYTPLHIAGTSNQLGITNDTTGHTATDGFSIAQVGLNTQLLNKEAGYMKLYTSDAVRLTIDSNPGHVTPGTDNAQDLGSASLRWRNVYTTDLHLANERGNWTVIEEEDYLTLRNNKTDKVYKLIMEEIK